MAIASFDWEGVGNGVAATQANTGIAPNNPSPGAGGSITGTSDAAVGSSALLFSNGTTAACFMQIPTVAATQLAVSVVFRMPAGPPPTTNNRIFAIYGGGTQRAYIVITPAGLLRAGGQGGSNEGSMAGGANMSAYYGVYVRIEFEWNSGTTTTDGTLTARLYPTPTSTTQVGTAYTGTAMSTGSGVTAAEVRVGPSNVQTVTGQGYTLDLTRIADGTATNPGPPPTATAPTVNAGGDQYPVTGQTVNLISTEAGTFSSGLWTCTEFPPESGSPSIAAPSLASTTANLTTNGRYVFRRTLSWTGTPVFDEMICYVHPASSGDVLVYGEYDATANWVNDGGAASRTAALNDGLQTTGIASLDNPANLEKKFVMRPWGLGPMSVYDEGYSRTATLTRTITLYKEDGVTVVNTWQHTTALEIANITEVKNDVDATGIGLLTGANDNATYTLRRALVVGVKSA